MKTTFNTGSKMKQPARCKACQALNVKCPEDHCRLHQPTLTQPQAQAIRQSGRNPAVLKQNCTGCQNTQHTPRNSPKTNRRARSRTKSPRGYVTTPQQRERNRSTSRTREEKTNKKDKKKSPQPKVRAILTNNDRQNNNNDNAPREWTQQTRETDRRPHYEQTPVTPERTSREQQWTWNYAGEHTRDYNGSRRSLSRPRWQQRSPSPNTRAYQQRSRSKSPHYRSNSRSNSPHTYRPRSQSASRYPIRDRPEERFSRSRASSDDPPRSQNPPTTPAQQ